jgi:hypothetical protein
VNVARSLRGYSTGWGGTWGRRQPISRYGRRS